MANWEFWTLILIFMGFALIGAWLQSYFGNLRNKYNAIGNSSGKTGAQVARSILDRNGITNVNIVAGFEGQDSFNSKTNTITLSPSVYNNASVSAQAIAAHEAGHAIQWANGETKIKIRDGLASVVNVTQQVAAIGFQILMFMFFFMFWTIPNWEGMYQIYFWVIASFFIAYLVMGLFQLITLPVEFDASKKATNQLSEMGQLTEGDEKIGTKKILNAAAMTYVVAFLATLTYLLYLFGVGRRS